MDTEGSAKDQRQPTPPPHPEGDENRPSSHARSAAVVVVNDEHDRKESPSHEPSKEDDAKSVATAGAASAAATEEPKKATEPELDFQVGVWRGKWQRKISCIICVDTNLIVRYFSAHKLLDLASFNEEKKDFVTIAETSLGSHELPPLTSIHHFEQRGEPFVIGLAEDKKRFVVFKIAEQRFHPTTVGSFPHTTTHLVMFKYRGGHYALAYNASFGEYTVFAMGPLVAGEMTAATMSKGRFRQGWSDVIWKGTHHVRCTRQRFFCYSSATGEVAFECVYVRGGSTSSSICSAEHVQMTAKESDHPMQAHLKKKGCIAVPLQLGGRLACLLYSHSALKPNANNGHDKSTSRLPVGQYGAGATVNVAQSASLLLQKKIFAHSEPWTHFCVLGAGSMEGGGVGEHMVCYSAISGEVWVNRIFHSSAPVKEVTLLKDDQPTHGPAATRRKSRSASSSGKKGLTKEALGAVGEEPVSVEHYATVQHQHQQTRATSPGAKQNQQRAKEQAKTDQQDTANNKESTPQRGTEGDTSRPDRINSARSQRSAQESFSTPLNPRPPTASRSLRERLGDLNTTDDYHADITRVLHTLQRHDFAPNSPAVQLALEDVAQLVPEDDKPLSSSSQRAQSARARGEKPPWVNVHGIKGRSAPPDDSWLVQFEDEYDRHRKDEVPNMTLEHKAMMRLYQPVHTREQYQAKHLAAEDKARARNMVGANKDDPHNPIPPPDGHAVMKTVKRLGVDDLAIREKKKETISKKHGYHPPESKKLDDDGQLELTKRMSDDAVILKHKKAEILKHKHQPHMPSPPPLSPQQRRDLSKRLVDDALAKHADKVRKVYHQMTDGHLPPVIKRDVEDIEFKAARLTKGESAEERV